MARSKMMSASERDCPSGSITGWVHITIVLHPEPELAPLKGGAGREHQVGESPGLGHEEVHVHQEVELLQALDHEIRPRPHSVSHPEGQHGSDRVRLPAADLKRDVDRLCLRHESCTRPGTRSSPTRGAMSFQGRICLNSSSLAVAAVGDIEPGGWDHIVPARADRNCP